MDGMRRDEPAPHQHWLTRTLQSRWVACAIAAGAGALIWAVSPRVTGTREPWDADGPYYVGALAVAGFGVGLLTSSREPAWSGATRPRSLIDLGLLLAIYSGIFGGQLAYMIAFLPAGPLLVLGVVFLGAFSVVAVLAAAIAGGFRRAVANAR